MLDSSIQVSLSLKKLPENLTFCLFFKFETVSNNGVAGLINVL